MQIKVDELQVGDLIISHNGPSMYTAVVIRISPKGRYVTLKIHVDNPDSKYSWRWNMPITGHNKQVYKDMSYRDMWLLQRNGEQIKLETT